MKIKKIWRTIKSAVESFTLGAGAASFVFGILAAFFSIALSISLPIVVAVGVGFGVVGVCYEIRNTAKKRRDETQKNSGCKETHDFGQTLVTLTQEIKNDLEHIKKDVPAHHPPTLGMFNQDNKQTLKKVAKRKIKLKLMKAKKRKALPQQNDTIYHEEPKKEGTIRF